MVVLLILIPLFSVGLVLYVTNLFEFISTGSFNEIMFIISSILTVVTSYFIAGRFVELIKSNKLSYLNKKNKILILGKYFSVVLLLLLGFSLLYQGILHGNIAQIIFGVGCVLVFAYITFMYFFYTEEKEFVLKNIVEHGSFKELHFGYEDVTVVYYINDNRFRQNQRYLIRFNKYTSTIKRIKV